MIDILKCLLCMVVVIWLGLINGKIKRVLLSVTR